MAHFPPLSSENFASRLAEKLSIPLVWKTLRLISVALIDAYVPTRDWTKMNEAVFMSGLGPDKLVDYGIDKISCII